MECTRWWRARQAGCSIMQCIPILDRPATKTRKISACFPSLCQFCLATSHCNCHHEAALAPLLIMDTYNGKRKASSPSVTPQSPTKRARKTHRVLDDTGRLSTAAVLAEQSTSSASAYLSIRESAHSTSDGHIVLQPGDRFPTLAGLCLRIIIANFSELFLDESGRVRNQDEEARNAIAWLRLLSPKLCNRVLGGLLQSTYQQAKATSPGTRPAPRVTVSALTELFLKSKNLTSFSLPPDFFRAAQPQYDPGNRLEDDFDPENELAGPQFFLGKNARSQNAADRALGRASRDRVNLLTALAQCTSLKSLNLSGQLKLQDSVAANLVKELPNLEEVNMKGCTEVGDEMVVQLARQAGLRGKLKSLNLNYTAVTVKGLKGLFSRCKSLEVLKLASMNGLVDAAVIALLDPSKYIPQDWKIQPLANLRTLKLRSTKIGDTGLRTILALCDSLTSLDISFTQVRSLDMLTNHLTIDHPNAAFEKLVLSGLHLRSETILTKFFVKYADIDEDRRRRLKTLKLGNLGLLDSQLMKITPLLEKFESLEKVSLHSNKTLATGTGSGVKRFLNGVGRKCRHLDLSYVPVSGRTLSDALLADYESFDVGDAQPSRLQVLLLDNTHVGDEITVAISTLADLEELHLEQAKITVEGMKTIMQGCPKLRIVNLTGCRGIPTRQRRDWFELYEKGEVGEED